MEIDIRFSMYQDTPLGRDPDTNSKTLNYYHEILWSKKLPNGEHLKLQGIKTKPYIIQSNNLSVDLTLSSDGIIHTYSKWKRMSHIIEQLPKEEVDDFFQLASTIGGYVLFPYNKVNNKPTINGARGINSKIKDRFDLTLECIRRWYLGIDSPLKETFDRYEDFFNIFVNFKGYVDFFLLNDLVSEVYDELLFWLPFEDFGVSNPLPKNFNDYMRYMKSIIEFVNKRNQRIKNYTKE